ncbi:non-canonical purine NTP pyrophosphatase [Prolixibacter bellariivorans]|uniref:dITP/XTP pyrophosphatase n=1 Tax=Prolixibacter bellariivorans TaxID=314319 RepID=A0A5M4AXP4_9BACT|nr:non-canonical purine NTP diphosphatase [Prolixibacter bellariivorans]GET32685.1 non-canonical purine NTP pyrophosphatase [Prolixibacter bellariivorans]
MKKLVFATNNPHKLRELREILGEQFELLSLNDIGCTDDIPETGDTLEANAAQKSFYIWERYQINCFADDTGLEIDALNGEPGVYSARYAGEAKDARENVKKVLRLMNGETNRTARFRTVISLIIDGKETQFDGIVEGEILDETRGDAGFGYDPIFLPEGKEKAFAEMEADEKNEISHRGRAVAKLVDYLMKN